MTIPGADVCACCGTHTATTGQAGRDQDPGVRELQGRRPAQRGLRRAGLAGGARPCGAGRPTSAPCSAAKADRDGRRPSTGCTTSTPALKFAHFGPVQPAVRRHGRTARPRRGPPSGSCPAWTRTACTVWLSRPERGHQRPVRRPDPHRQGHRLLPGARARRRCPRPDQSPERRPQWPGRRQARHLPGQPAPPHPKQAAEFLKKSGIHQTQTSQGEY